MIRILAFLVVGLDHAAVAHPAVVPEHAAVVVGQDENDAEDPHAHDRQLGGRAAEEDLADAEGVAGSAQLCLHALLHLSTFEQSLASFENLKFSILALLN